MIAINPYKQLDKIILKDGTEIQTNANIISARYDVGEKYASVTMLIKVSDLRDIIKTTEEIETERIDRGLPPNE